MANLLSMANSEAIRTLHQRNWSIRRIAKELGIHRDTVARHLRLQAALAPPTQPEPAPDPSQLGQAPIGSDNAKLGQAPIGSATPPPVPEPGRSLSLCEPFRAVILDKVAAGLTAQRIFQDLVREHSFTGKYPSVRRFVTRLSPNRPLPFRR